MSQYRKRPPAPPTVEAFQIEKDNLIEFIEWAKKHNYIGWSVSKDGIEVQSAFNDETAIYAARGEWVTQHHDKDLPAPGFYYKAWTDANFRATFEPVET